MTAERGLRVDRIVHAAEQHGLVQQHHARLPQSPNCIPNGRIELSVLGDRLKRTLDSAPQRSPRIHAANPGAVAARVWSYMTCAKWLSSSEV
mgnify:CR=1 FL=1